VGGGTSGRVEDRRAIK